MKRTIFHVLCKFGVAPTHVNRLVISIYFGCHHSRAKCPINVFKTFMNTSPEDFSESRLSRARYATLAGGFFAFLLCCYDHTIDMGARKGFVVFISFVFTKIDCSSTMYARCSHWILVGCAIHYSPELGRPQFEISNISM